MTTAATETASDVRFVGAVLGTWNNNGYHDSYWGVYAWDEGKQAVVKVETGATAYASVDVKVAPVGATPENLRKAEAWLADVILGRLIEAEAADAAVPTKGKRIRSKATRGHSVGVEGVVRWYGEDDMRSRSWRKAYKVGFAVDGERKLRYLPAGLVEVIDPQSQMADREALAKRAKDLARSRNWDAAFRAA